VEALKLTDRVQLLTSVSSEQLPNYYRAAAGLAYPSLFEGFGLPIAEGLLSGIPVLTSHGGCFPEAGGPDAIFVHPLEVEDIARGLVHIATMSAEERTRVVEAGESYGQRFHWKETTAKLLNHYQQVLA
jgi:glycosyltransferase involved in cell wall biosynthesis